MTEDGRPTPQEAADSKEYADHFGNAKRAIGILISDEKQNHLGIKSLRLEIGDYVPFNFFWNFKDQTFGVEFARESGELFGNTTYTFRPDTGAVDITGDVSFGDDQLPSLVYAPLDRPMGEVEDVRLAPAVVELPLLKSLVRFIEAPVRYMRSIEGFAKLPDEEQKLSRQKFFLVKNP